MTFGFQSAVDIATDTHRPDPYDGNIARPCLYRRSNGTQGRSWLTLHAGIAGGADVILIPEIPYDIDVIANVIQKRTQAGKTIYHSGSRRGRDLQGRRETDKERI